MPDVLDPPNLQEDDVRRYLTTSELATLLRTSPATVRFWRSVSRGPRSLKIGRRVLYDEADVVAWLDVQCDKPPGSSH